MKYSLYGLNLYSLFDVPKYFIFLTAFHPPQFITHSKALGKRGCPVGDGTLIFVDKKISNCVVFAFILSNMHETVQIYTFIPFLGGGVHVGRIWRWFNFTYIFIYVT